MRATGRAVNRDVIWRRARARLASRERRSHRRDTPTRYCLRALIISTAQIVARNGVCRLEHHHAVSPSSRAARRLFSREGRRRRQKGAEGTITRAEGGELRELIGQ